MNHPAVQRALAKAWADSNPDNPELRHEEGGWIYLNTLTGEFLVEHSPSGSRAVLDLSSPPALPNCVVVGKFHTHPNPSNEGWEPGPSESDLRVDDMHGVPDLIQADDG